MKRLEEKFRTGEFLNPNEGLNLVDLAEALASLAGAGNVTGPGADRLVAEIGRSDHLVFVLVDGLGMNLVETLPADSFLRSHVRRDLRSVFPSSTAPALTTLATGTWPGVHAVTSWWTHLPRAGATATILKFTERFGGAPLSADPRDVFPVPSMAPRLRSEVRSWLPAPIVESAYSKYSRGGTPSEGYATLPGAVDAIARRVREAKRPTYTYLYYPHLDAAEHVHGPFSNEARMQLDLVDRELGRLASGLPGRLVVSADHGQIEVPEGLKIFLAPDDPILEHLHGPPAGEMRMQTWRAKPGFAERFRQRFGDRFALLAQDEAAPLLGGALRQLSAEARLRIGDFVSVSLDGGILFYGPPAHHREEAAMRGYHGGLLPDEMRVPLIVA